MRFDYGVQIYDRIIAELNKLLSVEWLFWGVGVSIGRLIAFSLTFFIFLWFLDMYLN